MAKQQGGFEIISETGDVVMRVWGCTVEDVFRYAVLGLTTLVLPNISKLAVKGAKIKEELSAHAVDVNSMLVEFLSGALTRMVMEGLGVTGVTFAALGEDFLESVIEGVRVEEFEREIQAVAEDSVDVKKNAASGYFETMVTFVV